jgi:putative serine protease PepD
MSDEHPPYQPPGGHDSSEPPPEQPWATYPTPSYPAPDYPAPDYPAPDYPTSSYPSGSYATYPPAYPPVEPLTAPVAQTKSSATRRTVVLAAVVAAVVGGGVGAGTVAIADRHSKSVSSGITVTNQTAANTPKLDGTISAAAAKIMPSVVTIDVSGQSEAGTGSGVILRSDGYILTNNHVVAVAGTSGAIQVLTSDGRSARATIVGTDQSDDLAVIKTDLSGLSPATFGKSSTLVVGQSVIAIGAPLGLSNTVTSGIVSNIARPVSTGDTSTSTATFDAIQTDAAINPGNSGGPLVDLNGTVMGIDAAIASANSGGVTVPGQSTQSGSIGIGFAIPSDEASRIAGELIATGKATHAVIGVSVGGTNSTSTTAGAVISAVSANSPAQQAGLAVGDIVTRVNSQLITADVDLVAAIRSYAPGSTVSITYTRAGATHTVEVTLGTAAS